MTAVLHLLHPTPMRLPRLCRGKRRTWCGRKLDQDLGQGQYLNGSAHVQVTDCVAESTCQRCRKHYGPLVQDMQR